MRNFIQGFLLFLALFLTGVDTKATVADEDNFTTATVWVDEWTTRMETLYADSMGEACDSKKQKAIAGEVNFFVREAHKTLEKKLSQDDLRYLENTAFYAWRIINKKPCFAHQAAGLSVLKKDLENRLE